jgi:hypothetical protein
MQSGVSKLEQSKQELRLSSPLGYSLGPELIELHACKKLEHYTIALSISS